MQLLCSLFLVSIVVKQFDACIHIRIIIVVTYVTTCIVMIPILTNPVGNSGCGFGSGSYPVYLEYHVNETSYLLKQLRYRALLNYTVCYLNMLWFCFNRTTSSTLLTIQLPLLARSEGVQFSWNQSSGFNGNEEVWQLDNVALIHSNEINLPLLSTFSGLEQSSSVMFYSGGSVEVVIQVK